MHLSPSSLRPLPSRCQIRLSTGEEFEEGECSLPSLEYETTAVWIDLPLHAKRHMDAAGHDVTASIHAVNHILSSICPLFAEVRQTHLISLTPTFLIVIFFV